MVSAYYLAGLKVNAMAMVQTSDTGMLRSEGRPGVSTDASDVCFVFLYTLWKLEVCLFGQKYNPVQHIQSPIIQSFIFEKF